MITRDSRILGLALSLSAVLAVGCDAPNEYVPPPPPVVTVSAPTQETVTEYLEFTGTTGSVAVVEIRSRVKGFLETVHFLEGDIVEEGALLFSIDPREFDAAVREAEAAENVAKAGLELAEATNKRMKEAVAKKAVSVIAALESEAQRDQAAALLAQRRAELERVKLDREYAEVRAPISGRVGRKMVHEGNLVGAGENTLLTEIVQYDPIYVWFNIAEREILELIRGTGGREMRDPAKRIARLREIPLELGLANDADYPFKGNMHYTDPEVDPDTGTLLVRGIFPNAPPAKILPGLFAKVRTPYRQVEDALLVPELALGSDQSGRYVLVVDDKNIVQQRSVAVGRRVGTMRVIESGLGSDDRVIINGLLRARPGAEVSPQDAASEAPSESKPESKPAAEEDGATPQGSGN